MPVSIIYSGRLGNNLFQYAAAYLFAKKFNLNIISNVVNNCFDLPILNNPMLFSSNIIDINDENFMSILESESIERYHYRFVGYYQLKDFILKYQDEIKSLFTLKFINKPENEVFVAYRIGDINGERQMLPIEYYEDALNTINPDGGYISSDTPNHPNVLTLSKKYNLSIYNSTPLDTINFAKNFNNIILSEGSFSWWIGFLSKAKNIYYNERTRFWHGDIFVLPEWISLRYDWDSSCIGNSNKLICNKIKKNV